MTLTETRISRWFQGKATSDCDPPSSITTRPPVDTQKAPKMDIWAPRRRGHRLCQWPRGFHLCSIPPMANVRTWLLSKRKTSSLSVSNSITWTTKLLAKSSHTSEVRLTSKGQTFMDMMMTIMRLNRILQVRETAPTRWSPTSWTREHRCCLRASRNHHRCSSSARRGTSIWQITG